MDHDVVVDAGALFDGAEADLRRKGLRLVAYRLTCTEDEGQRLWWTLSALVTTSDGRPLEAQFVAAEVFDASGLLVHVNNGLVRADLDRSRGHVLMTWRLPAGSDAPATVRLVVEAPEHQPQSAARGSEKYPTLSGRELAKVASRPERSIGLRATTWAKVVQVQSDYFIAEVRARPSRDPDDYDEPVCVFETGEAALADLVDGDLVEVRGKVFGSFTYTTVRDIERTVPWWTVKRMRPLVQVE